LTAAWGSLAKTLHSLLEVARAPFGERQGSIGHAPQLHAFLGTCGRYGALKVGACLLGVKALRCTSAKDGQSSGLVLRLCLELLVGALLERLDRLLSTALLDADLSLLGRHGPPFYACGTAKRVRPAGGALFSLSGHRFRPMRRIYSYLTPVAVLLATCIVGQTVLSGAAWGAAAPAKSTVSPQVSKEVQEALAKAEAEKGAGGSSASSSGGGSSASGEAYSNLTGKGSEEEEAKTQTTASTSSTATSSTGTSTNTVLIILVVAGLLLGGIAFFIVRDARSVAPAGDGLVGDSSRDQAARMRKRRAKAKAARRQRKRNR
jgi:hypothetical protein